MVIFFANKATQYKNIHALPCLRYETQSGKPMPISYPANPISLGDKIRKKRMDLKLFQKDVAKICGVTEDSITNWEKNRNEIHVKCFPSIISFLGYFPFEIDTTTLMGKLKAYRFKNGLTPKQLGTIIKVDPSTVRSWELGEHIPPKKTLEKLELLGL